MRYQEELRMNRTELVTRYLNGETLESLSKPYGCNANTLRYFFIKEGIVKNPRTKHKDSYPKIKELHDQGKSAYAISTELNIPVQCVCRALEFMDIKISSGYRVHAGGPLSNKKEEIIRKYLDGTGCYKLSHEYNCAESSILNLLKANNIQIRKLKKYPVDDTFFEKIDNRNKAWILGWLATDGCNTVSRKTFSIHSTDLDVIDKMIKIFDYKGNINTLIPKNPNHSPNKCLKIYCPKLSVDLEKLGCGTGKTYNLKFPTKDIVPDEFLQDYCRGAIEGDGTINQRTSNERWFTGIVGTKEFCEGFSTKINEILGLHTTLIMTYKNPTSGFEIWRVNVLRIDEIKIFLDWIYSTSTPETRMNRKYEKYQEFLKYYAEKHPNSV